MHQVIAFTIHVATRSRACFDPEPLRRALEDACATVVDDFEHDDPRVTADFVGISASNLPEPAFCANQLKEMAQGDPGQANVEHLLAITHAAERFEQQAKLLQWLANTARTLARDRQPARPGPTGPYGPRTTSLSKEQQSAMALALAQLEALVQSFSANC